MTIFVKNDFSNLQHKRIDNKNYTMFF